MQYMESNHRSGQNVYLVLAYQHLPYVCNHAIYHSTIVSIHGWHSLAWRRVRPYFPKVTKNNVHHLEKLQAARSKVMGTCVLIDTMLTALETAYDAVELARRPGHR